jgi:hypothetical protein
VVPVVERAARIGDGATGLPSRLGDHYLITSSGGRYVERRAPLSALAVLYVPVSMWLLSPKRRNLEWAPP